MDRAKLPYGYDLAGQDDDLMAEVVRSSETRTYLRRIYELYSIYRGVYVGV